MDPLETLAHYTGEAARVETSEGLAKRCGILDKRDRGIKNWIHRAIHPNEAYGHEDRHYAAVVGVNLCKLLDGLGLTFAPVDNSVPSTAHVLMLISQMEMHPVAKAMVTNTVHRAAMIPTQEKEPT